MSGNNSPEISVLMSVYNTNDVFLREAIDSVLNQTLCDFEFIIIDDCTNEENLKTIKSFNDPRIRLIHNQENLGLTKSLNKAIDVAQGKYLVRMDADDISLPDRFEKQISYLRKNPDVLVLGGYAQILGKQKIFMSRIDDYDTMRMRMLFFNCVLVHPTAVFNAKLLKECGIRYDENVRKSQDYMMWANCIQIGKIEVLNEVVLKYRIHSGQSTSTYSEEQRRCAMEVQKKLLIPLLGDSITEYTLKLHYSITFGKYCAELSEYVLHMKNLLEQNRKVKLFDTKKFQRECSFMWLLMSIKGAVFYRDFRGVFSVFFLNAVLHINYWGYYYKHFFKNIIEERSAMKRVTGK